MKKPPSLAREAWLKDPALRRVFAAIEAVGGEARVAGGAVRNALLREPVSEIDIATTLTPERIKEDHLRILRFFRFHARYGAGAPDGKGLAACIQHKGKLRALSSERVRQELFKLLEAGRASETVRLMASRNVLKVLFAHVSDLSALERMAKIDMAQGLKPDALLRLVLLAKA